MEKKMTKVQMFEAIKEVEGVKANEDFVAFIDHEIALIKKKGTYRNTKVDEANTAIREALEAVLKVGEGMTVTEIMATDEIRATNATSQKVTSVLSKMKDEGTAIREQEGRKKPTYSKVAV